MKKRSQLNKNRTRSPKAKRIVPGKDTPQAAVDTVVRTRRRVPERDGLLFDHDGSDPADNPNVGAALRGLRALEE